jgi:hypothetical protein
MLCVNPPLGDNIEGAQLAPDVLVFYNDVPA